MASRTAKRATIGITSDATALPDTPRRRRGKNNGMSLDDYKAYLSILQQSDDSSLKKPALSIASNQWSIQESPSQQPEPTTKYRQSNASSVEYSAYQSTIDPNEELPCLTDMDTSEISNVSSSFDLNDHKYDFTQTDGVVLSKYGYKLNKVLSHTIHGCIYSAEIISKNTNNYIDTVRNKINLPFTVGNKSASLVRIKKFEKENGNCDRIISESLILHYLTIKNIPPSPNICKYIDFVETKHSYYLIQEYGRNMVTLDSIILCAHKYIKQKRMKKKHWRIIVKYLFWQCIATCHWMHKDMRVCHLELNTMNIFVENAKFIENSNGLFTVNTKNIAIKLYDFGESEVFSLGNKCEHLQCYKKDIISDFFYKDHKVLSGDTFNPVKADMYSLGLILFKMFVGCLPYQEQSNTDHGYNALRNGNLRAYLKENGFLKGTNKYTMDLVINLLSFEEEKRMMTSEVIRNDWFKNYYVRYKKSIQQKSKSQKERHMRQMDEYRLPYFEELDNEIEDTENIE